MGSEFYKTVPLEELVTIHDAERRPVTKSNRKPGPYPYYGASGITDYVDGYLFDGDYVLLAEDGDNLRTRKTPIAFMARGKFWVNNHAHVFRAKDGVSTNFVCYALQVAEVESYISGSTRPKITQADMRQIPISAPPQATRVSIANILSSLDDKNQLNHQMNQTLEAMAQALFKSWFVDFDPVIDGALDAGNPIPESLAKRAEARKALKANGEAPALPEEIRSLFPDAFRFDEERGWIPEGWRVSTLKDCTSKIGSGSTPRGGSSAYIEEGVRLVRSQNIHDSSFRWDGIVCITDEAAHKMKGVTLTERDVLINITGDSILRSCVVDPSVLPARVNQHVAIIRPIDGIPEHYIHQYIVRQEYKAYLSGLDSGGSRQAITKGHLEEAKILLPLENLLKAFSENVYPLFQRKKQNCQQMKVLAGLRDTLLPKLISGELKIPDAKGVVEEVVAGTLAN